MTAAKPVDQTAHTEQTREAYDRLAAVWTDTTDDGPYNGHLERPALRSLVPQPLTGSSVLDAGCGSGAQCEWLLSLEADVTGIDLSPSMVEATQRRCANNGQFLVADLAAPLPFENGTFHGITCSLALHYLEDWNQPLQSFYDVIRPGGWAVISLDHPFGPPLRNQQGGYFDTELVSDTWIKGDVEVTQHFWRRPLSVVSNAFANAGFLIDRIVETRPSDASVERFPDDLRHTLSTPSFIVYRLVRK